MIVRGLVAGVVLAVLMIAGWFVTLRAVEREVDNRYGTSTLR
jgi:TRAP-type C4-dicarboxylate transport system permease small subunit